MSRAPDRLERGAGQPGCRPWLIRGCGGPGPHVAVGSRVAVVSRKRTVAGHAGFQLGALVEFAHAFPPRLVDLSGVFSTSLRIAAALKRGSTFHPSRSPLSPTRSGGRRLPVAFGSIEGVSNAAGWASVAAVVGLLTSINKLIDHYGAVVPAGVVLGALARDWG